MSMGIDYKRAVLVICTVDIFYPVKELFRVCADYTNNNVLMFVWSFYKENKQTCHIECLNNPLIEGLPFASMLEVKYKFPVLNNFT